VKVLFELSSFELALFWASLVIELPSLAVADDWLFVHSGVLAAASVGLRQSFDVQQFFGVLLSPSRELRVRVDFLVRFSHVQVLTL